MTLDFALFALLAFVAIVTAILMLTSQNSVYSALFLVLNFGTVAVFYLLLNAPFIAMLQITVYAGAIMVLFLFVIMLLGRERAETEPSLPYQMPVAIVLGCILVLLLGYALLSGQTGAGEAIAVAMEGFGSPQAVGELLFTGYLIPFEVTSILLLVAMVGAILLTRDEPQEGESQ